MVTRLTADGTQLYVPHTGQDWNLTALSVCGPDTDEAYGTGMKPRVVVEYRRMESEREPTNKEDNLTDPDQVQYKNL